MCDDVVGRRDKPNPCRALEVGGAARQQVGLMTAAISLLSAVVVTVTSRLPS
jgi:hypothetical protein